MRELEAKCETLGISTNQLMDNAGLSIAEKISKIMGVLKGLKILALVGSGNNGADCLIASGHLARWGASVTAIILKQRDQPDLRLDEAVRMGVSYVDLSSEREISFSSVEILFKEAHLILDGILGIGATLPIREPLKTFLSEFKSKEISKPKIFSIDVPSGADSDTSELDVSAIKPDVTLALGFLKPCHVNQPASDFCGEISVCDIGVPSNLGFQSYANLMSDEHISSILPVRDKFSHKGRFGKVMVVGGSDNYIGAPALAASSALKTGAGLATIASYDNLIPTMGTLIPEATFVRLKPDKTQLKPGSNLARQIFEILGNYNVLLIGCGFGVSKISREIFESLVLSDLELPQLVLDADALNLLSKVSNWWDRLPDNSIVTPHPAEMSRLTRLSVSEIQSDRLAVSKKFAERWGVIVVLKGANTVVSTPNGNSIISPVANSILSSAGTGDVLAGIIAGFAAQLSDPLEAASLGVHVHGKSAAELSIKMGSSGMLASELAAEVPFIIKKLRDRERFGST